MRRAALAAAAVALAAVPAAHAARGPVSVAATFRPAAHFFADPVTARVDVAVDPTRVDPGTVAVTASFSPYVALARRVERLDGGPHLLVLRFLYTIRCTSAACVPRAPQRTFSLHGAVVRYRLRSGEPGAADAVWPPLVVASRLTPRDLALPALRAQVPPPAPSYRLAPGPLGWGLVAGGGALALAGAAALAVLLRPRRRAVATPPLVLALALVERASAAEVGERRRALYRLALALEDAGLEPAAREARKLAWASTAPDAARMRNLAADVRGRLEAA